MSGTAFAIDGCDVPQRLLQRRGELWGDAVALRYKDRGLWRPVTWRDYAEQVQAAGNAFLALGLAPGDVVAVLAENRPEWLVFDLGAQSVGGIGTGVYTTSSAEQVEFQLADSDARVLLVDTDEQLEKALAVRARCPKLERIVLLERRGLGRFADPMVEDWPAFLSRGRAFGKAEPAAFGKRLAAVAPADIAVLVYTSGTTGRPKAAMISNANFMFQIAHAPSIFVLGPGDPALSFLPLCHIAERNAGAYFPLAFGHTVHFAENAGTVFADLAEVQPRALFAPPRIWEKMYSQIALAMDDAILPARRAYAHAIRRGRMRAEAVLAGSGDPGGWTDRLFDSFALRNVRTRLGLGRLRHGMTGAAPISSDLIRWFLALGVNLREAYGATETSGLCTIMPYEQNRPGTVGKPPDTVELKIGAEGEILVRGPNVFAGYRKRPDLTAETIDKEGWLHTGDVGEIDADGFLRITDRIKDILITAGGKNVTPSQIENQLKFSPYISDAVAIGDRRPYLTALVMLDHDNVAQFAQSRAVPFTNYASLARAPEIVALIKGEIEAANAKLARVEQIKDFRIIDTQLTAEDEELTPTMKLKRKLVNQKYAGLIDGMYQ